LAEGGQHGTVLLVEDDEALRLLCRTVLQLEGYDVVEAQTQREVDDALAESDMRVALLDVHLGDESGIDIARSLRRSHPALPIVLFSGSAQLYGSAAEELAAAIVSKPFEVDELLEVVNRVSA
jgi:two-component system OmpR family response regulator